ncbi:MAG TPA: heme-binding protein [Candidatus Acidoferrum sp.]|nr:heme-binding protein [Candidatus Acidoferrum sp.]
MRGHKSLAAFTTFNRIIRVFRHCFQLVLALLAVAAHAADTRMTSNEVTQVISQAIARAQQIEPDAVIAVVDREGFVLGVWSVNGAGPDPINVLDAITKAGTASFLSSDQHAFTSRTAGFIVQQHFPPTIRNRPPGPLVGVNFSNMSFTDVNRFKNPHAGFDPLSLLGGTNGAAITGPAPLTGLAGSPGGVPLFRDRLLIGGIGVAGHTRANTANPLPPLADIQRQQGYDPDEDVALAGQRGFVPPQAVAGSHVFLDGIRAAYLRSSTRVVPAQPLGTIGAIVPPYDVIESPVVSYPTDIFGGQLCEVRAPITADTATGDISGQSRLTESEVRQILAQATARARITRAGIRLPRGQPAQVFIAVVNNPALADTSPVILGTIRTPGATIFSWDVAVQKARTALFFSDNTRAYSTRTVGFLAQRFFPPGIANRGEGPLLTLQEQFSLLPAGIKNPLNGVVLTTNALSAPDPNVPNGITIFPGGFPLYRNGVMIGAIGVSGDGVDQDDIIAAAGTVGFQAPTNIRADRMRVRGARLPYAKFPRNPNL